MHRQSGSRVARARECLMNHTSRSCHFLSGGHCTIRYLPSISYAGKLVLSVQVPMVGALSKMEVQAIQNSIAGWGGGSQSHRHREQTPSHADRYLANSVQNCSQRAEALLGATGEGPWGHYFLAELCLGFSLGVRGLEMVHTSDIYRSGTCIAGRMSPRPPCLQATVRPSLSETIE